MTKELFKENVYQKTVTAKVTFTQHSDKGLLVVLDRTIFFPTGGGQSCDKGTIDEYIVTNVYHYSGEVYHLIEDDNCTLKIGDTVTLTIDWEHRFDNMQRHCGEHILSGILHREYGGVNRGFHMGEEYMTIDISLEDNPKYTALSWDMLLSSELYANEVIWENLPVITRHFDTHDEASKLPLRKALTLDEDITIVSIGSTKNPSDCVACCGTHPAYAGQVGLIKIYKVEPNKGMFRVFFEAGKRAFKNYQNDYNIITTLGNSLSAGTSDIMEKYKANQNKQKEIRTELHQIKKLYLSKEADEIKTEMGSFYVRKYDAVSIDDLLHLSRDITEAIKDMAFLVHEPSNTVLLLSNGSKKYDCGKLVKENASIYNGKGGGNKNSARAIFPKAEYIDTFIDLLEKHLR